MKAHHDDECAYEALPWEAKLNCDFDSQAAAAHTCDCCRGNRPTDYILPPGHSATLHIEDPYDTTHVPMAIRNAA